MKMLYKMAIAGVVLSSVFSTTNANNSASIRIDEVTISTSTIEQRRLIDSQGDYSKINLTIKPLALGYSDGKWLVITDANNNTLYFTINDIHEMEIWSEATNTAVSYYDSIPIKAGLEYDFVLYVAPTGIDVYFSSGKDIRKIMAYNFNLTAPFKYELIAQRTGANFRNVIIKNKS